MGGNQYRTKCVRMSDAELKIARYVAQLRNERAAMDRKRGVHGAPEGSEGEELHVAGAIAEYAVAKAFNLYWNGTVGEYGATDVGGLLEVRARSKSHYDLMLHDKDTKPCPYILAICHAGSVDVDLRGWIYAVDGKVRKYWKDPAGGRPAYFVPQSVLRPMWEIEAMINGRVAA